MAQFGQAVRSTFSQIRSAYSSSGPTGAMANVSAPNITGGNVTTTIDSYNRTITESGQVFHRYVIGWVADVNKLQVAEARLASAGSFNTNTGLSGGVGTYGTSVNRSGVSGVYAKDLQAQYGQTQIGSYTNLPADYDKVLAAENRMLPLEREQGKLQQQFALQQAEISSRQMVAAENFEQAQKRRIALENQYITLAKIGGGQVGAMQIANATEANALLEMQVRPRNAAGRLLPASAGTVPLFSSPQALAQAVSANDPSVQAALMSYRGMDALTPQIKAAANEEKTLSITLRKMRTEENKMLTQQAEQTAAVNQKYAGRIAELEAAKNSIAPLPKDLEYFLQNSSQFRNQFNQKMGITTPYTAPAAANASAAEKARIDTARQAYAAQVYQTIEPGSVSASYDYSKGITSLTVSAKNANDVTGTLTASLDKENKVVNNGTNSFRNQGSFLKQTVVDFKKVVEWTVATTAVFGVLGVAVGSFSKINQITMDLARFSLTAKTSGEQTSAAFQNVAKVAYDTATPLQSLTAVMDDIALATRRTTQTAQEWTQAQTDLTKAVAIFTNLTGADTKQATDLLSAAYKQMGIATDEILTIMSKITAVAGGNAQAIQDITQALGSVSEAAKSSGLSIDQQIAAVQVLSQVTNKSSTDVATSFKNLFGALSSAGSVRVLSQFGIAVKDAAGNLRPFLDIYNDIYNAVQSGKISPGQLQDVLKGISGGPRRAPDAAALLENMPLIYEAYTKSINATNDALIANARVIDTNQAKLQQLNTAFDTTLVNNFTDAINKMVKALYDIGTFFGGSGAGDSFSGVLTAVTQMGLMLVAVSALGKVLPMLTSGLKGIRGMFDSLALSEKTAAGSLNKFANSAIVPIGVGTGGVLPAIPGLRVSGPAGPAPRGTPSIAPGVLSSSKPPPVDGYVVKGGPVSGYHYEESQAAKYTQAADQRYSISNYDNIPANVIPSTASNAEMLLLRNKVLGSTGGRIGLGVGLGALAGGALLAAGAGNAGSSLGSTAQMGGLLLATSGLGGPIGIAAGVTVTALGTAFQFMSDQAQKADDQMKALKNSVYDNIQSLTTERDTLNTNTKAQADAKVVIDELSAKKKLTADETATLTQAQDSYVTSSFAVAAAQKQISETTATLLTQIPQLSQEYKDLLSQYTTTQLRMLSPEVLQTLSASIAASILGVSFPKGYQIQTGTGNEPVQTVVGVHHQTVGAPYTTPPPPKPAEDVAKGIMLGSINDAIKLLLETPAGVGSAEPYILNKSVIDAFTVKMNSVTDDATKGSSDFLKASSILADLTSKIASSGSMLSQNLQYTSADVTARSLTGMLTSTQSTEAQGHLKVGTDLASYTDSLRMNDAYNAATHGIGPQRMGTKQLNTLLYGSDGKSGILGGSNLFTPLTLDQARTLFSALQQLDPAMKGFAKDTATFDAQTYKWLSDQQLSVDGLKGSYNGLSDEQVQLQTDIAASQVSGKTSLFSSMADLQAQLQGGQIDKGQYNSQNGQLLALISLYDKLGEAMKNNVANVADFGEQLGKIHGLEGINLLDQNAILPALVDRAQKMGLNGKQIQKLMTDYLAFLNVSKQLSDVKVKFSAQANLPTAQFVTYLKAQRAVLMASLLTAKGADRRNIMSTINAITGGIAAIGAAGNIASDLASGSGTSFGGTGSGGSSKTPGLVDVPAEFLLPGQNTSSLINQAVANAKSLQSKVPGANKDNAGQILEILNGTKILLKTNGLGQEYLTKAMDELTAQIKKQNDLLTKADAMKQIRVGAGSFAAIANVPINSTTGVSVSGSGGTAGVNVILNLDGSALTPAQFDQLANKIVATLKANGVGG